MVFYIRLKHNVICSVFFFFFFFFFFCWYTVFFLFFFCCFFLLGYCFFSCGCYSIIRLIICCEKCKECHRRCFCLCFILIVNVHLLLVFFDLLLILFRKVLWPSAGKDFPSAFPCSNFQCRLGCACPSLVLYLGGMWKSIVSAPDHCLFVYFSQSTQAQGHRQLLKSGPGMGHRKRSPSAEGTGRGEHDREVSDSRKRGSGKCKVQKGGRCVFIASLVQFRFINSVHFVGMLKEIFLILVTF